MARWQGDSARPAIRQGRAAQFSTKIFFLLRRGDVPGKFSRLYLAGPLLDRRWLHRLRMLCHAHHVEVHSHPAQARAMGLLK